MDLLAREQASDLVLLGRTHCNFELCLGCMCCRYYVVDESVHFVVVLRMLDLCYCVVKQIGFHLALILTMEYLLMTSMHPKKFLEDFQEYHWTHGNYYYVRYSDLILYFVPPVLVEFVVVLVLVSYLASHES